MSEEKPTFKITDRRLFNPDGSPREGMREEEVAPPAATENDAVAATATQPAPDANQPASPIEREPPAASPAAATGGIGETQPAPEQGRGFAPQQAGAPEDDDPQEFLMVVEFVASFAADALGMVNHPGAGGREVNLPLAKQCIDMLGTLRKKTRGNLSAEEEQFFELVLSQLRMQYLSLSGGARGGASGPRGFSGSDITGGR